MQRSARTSLVLALALAGCDILDPILTTGGSDGETGPIVTSTGTTTGDPDPETSGAVTTAVTDTTTDPGSSDSNDSGAFIFPPDPPAECDVWAQDCPAGQKCSASGPPPLGSDNIECVPVVPDPDQAGEPCQVLVEGHLGPDTCDFGLYCWPVDPDTGFGTCVELCHGSINDPLCDPGFTCLNTDVPMCLPACDPLLQDCPAGQSCRDAFNGWACFDIDPPPGAGTFEGCEAQWHCDAGLACVSPEGASECDLQQLGCCTPLCDLSAANSCPGAGQQCLPWYEPGAAPAGYEDVGVCHLPA